MSHLQRAVARPVAPLAVRPTGRVCTDGPGAPARASQGAAATNGAGVPRVVEAEFRAFLGCGLLTRGIARVRCDDCACERLVPFSCKGRFCPSCCGRPMAAQAAQLVDRVLPAVAVRPWVLTVPHRLRYRLAFDHALARAVLRVFVRALLTLYRRRPRGAT